MSRERHVRCLLFTVATILGPLHATGRAEPSPVSATFSILARDPSTGELGVAVQSRYFAVGAAVPFAEGGVDAIASQAMGNPAYGTRGLQLLREGRSVEETLAILLAEDPQRETRQVGIIDAQGHGIAHTGAKTFGWSGHRTGPEFAVQRNILVSEATVVGMERAFTTTRGPLAERMLRALEEGQDAGGDRRGMQAAALLIVKKGAGYGGTDRYCDLRVDDHAEPIKELRRANPALAARAMDAPDFEALRNTDGFRQAVGK